MNSTEVKRLIDRMDALPTLPNVVTKLLHLAGDETSNAEAIASVIESDQSLTARTLHLVNTPSFGFPSEIKTVSRAAVVLGTNTIRCIALGMGVVKTFPSGGHATGFPSKEFWKHSLACAVCAEMLAQHSKHKIEAAEAFVAGLLHDIGKIVLSSCLERDYQEIADLAREQDIPLLQAEENELGIQHTAAGKWLAERWGLPASFGHAMWLHHHPPSSVSSSEFDAPLIFIVNAANTIARQLRIGFSGNEEFSQVDDELLKEIGVSAEDLDQIENDLWKRVEERSCIVDIEVDEATLHFESVQKANRALTSMMLKAEHRNRRLQRRERRFRALHTMNTQMRPGQTLEDVLVILAKTLRDGFEITSGICSVVDGEKTLLSGRAWQDGGPLHAFDIALRANGNPKLAHTGNIDPETKALLTETIMEPPAEGADGASPVPLRRRGLFVIPMISEGANVGQLVLDLRAEESTSDGSVEMGDILTFSSAAGFAISRVHMSEMLSRQAEELAAAVWKREQIHKQLLHSERLAAVGEMAAGAAHEINNPLAIISGRAQMMLHKETDAEKARALGLIVDQCTRASKILSDLMRFARPALPKKEPVSLNAVVYEVLSIFEERYRSHGIELNHELAASLPKILLDRGQMQQVLVNLLINAEHAITSPGIVTVTTSITPSGNMVTVAVSDTGCGIPRERLKTVFEPFFTTKEEGKGTGLGLSLAHSIVAAHEGTIGVKSTVNKGTTFTVSLPVTEDLKEETKPDRPQSAVSASTHAAGKRVLVVDDEEHVRAVISEALSEAGYEVEQAANGHIALEIARQTHVDLITLDIRMPRMDGMSVLRALRDQGPKRPVIVVTGLASEEEIETAKELGVFTCIRKPFEVTQLLAETDRALANAQ